MTVLFALVGLLNMQFALAGHLCASLLSGSTDRTAPMVAAAEMPCAELVVMDSTGVDKQQAGLCHAHCQAGQQSDYKYELPTPAAMVPVGGEFLPPAYLLISIEAPRQAPQLTRTTAPPLAIRHCCWRI